MKNGFTNTQYRFTISTPKMAKTLAFISIYRLFASVLAARMLMGVEPCKKVPYMAYLRHSPKNVGGFVGG